MSADNGVYILKSPAPPKKDGNCYTMQHGEFEYRVAHCQAIENIDCCHLYVPLLFGDSPIFHNQSDAWLEAKRLANDIQPLEYGVSEIEILFLFPNMTRQAAAQALDCYVGAEPLDICQSE